ncbi:MAG: type I-B CRISPR-associated protein Cas5b [Sulfurimonas sp.]|uniref:type I-B CRISPR-associated protein Cas5b n=1 Tax=Sulfurimonas sp. TaxID=2022749 RepID=UPI00260AAF88|nr:type I-B CRISPR-associated protein Cas5b [Sulfurimonas sp.]MDD5373782.1 type I-B CRISPR-associated protein Cas5b [Sulfurimonas sp.]
MSKIDKVISFDIESDFGMFKKPDVNNPIYFTYNIISKPTLLGILGAIVGFGGYSQMQKGDDFPQFYKEFEDLLISVAPLEKRGVFQKRIIKYNNTVGYANKDGGTLNISEQTLINPSYKIYVALDLSKNSHQLIEKYLLANKTENGYIPNYEYIPYMGKNEFKLEIKNIQVFENLSHELDEVFAISTLFQNNGKEALKMNEVERDPFDISMSETYFYYFERLPVLFDELGQYQYENFSYTNAKFSKDSAFVQDLKLVKISDRVICLY